MDARIKIALITGVVFYMAGTILTCSVKCQQTHVSHESPTIIQKQENLNEQ